MIPPIGASFLGKISPLAIGPTLLKTPAIKPLQI